MTRLGIRNVTRWRTRGPLGLALVGAAVLVAAYGGPSWASDHDDAPSLAVDPGPDIADVYAFMRPESTSHMVLSMTVATGATSGTPFDPSIEYAFRVLAADSTGALDPSVDTRIHCRFEIPTSDGQLMLCTGNGFSAFTKVGDSTTADESAPMRVFAGLRADPAFGDVAALATTMASKQLSFSDAGTNSFAGKNVLAIVLEVDVDKVLLAGLDGGTRPLLAVSAVTERVPL